MESPLHVLSTAASMLENVDTSRDTSATSPSRVQHNSMPSPDSPNCHPEHIHNRENKICIATQTSVSDLSSYSYQYYNKLRYVQGGVPQCRLPSPDYSEHSPAVYNSWDRQHGASHTSDLSTENNMPLNLTVSSVSHQRHSSRLSPRQGVRVSPDMIRSSGVNHSARFSSSGEEQANHKSPVSHCSGEGPTSDPEIEEHFRRSLGSKYRTLFSGCIDQDSQPANSLLHISGQSSRQYHRLPSQHIQTSAQGKVDDHFAQSLGATWTSLNANCEDTSAVSVDDHFTKALGDTWLKIKAQNNSSTPNSRNPTSISKAF